MLFPFNVIDSPPAGLAWLVCAYHFATDHPLASLLLGGCAAALREVVVHVVKKTYDRWWGDREDRRRKGGPRIGF